MLITNGDVLLNDDLYVSLARRRLDPDCFFRAPRVELGSEPQTLNPKPKILNPKP